MSGNDDDDDDDDEFSSVKNRGTGESQIQMTYLADAVQSNISTVQSKIRVQARVNSK